MIGSEFEPLPDVQPVINRDRRIREFAWKVIEMLGSSFQSWVQNEIWLERQQEARPSLMGEGDERVYQYCAGRVELGFSGDPDCSDEKINSLVISAQDKLDLRFLNRKPSKFMGLEPVDAEIVVKRSEELEPNPLFEPTWRERHFGS